MEEIRWDHPQPTNGFKSQCFLPRLAQRFSGSARQPDGLLCRLGVNPKTCPPRGFLLIKLNGMQERPRPSRPFCRGYRSSSTRRFFTYDAREHAR